MKFHINVISELLQLGNMYSIVCIPRVTYFNINNNDMEKSIINGILCDIYTTFCTVLYTIQDVRGIFVW